MTPRYLILARGDVAARHAIAAAVARATSVVIVAELETATVLADQIVERGPTDEPLVIGDMFANRGGARASSSSIAQRPSSPEALVADTWGRYVAIFDDGARGMRILRDPSGALSCYYRCTAGLIAVASDLALLNLAAPTRGGLDWNEIGRILVEVDLRGPRTGLADTLELLPGTMLAIRPAATLVSTCWSPWDYAQAACNQAPSEQAAGLRERIITVVTALASDHRRALATVSGGLDSSIVALILADRLELTCLTLATTDPSGDERRYARLIAEATASGYLEHMLDPAEIDVHRSQATHLPRPIGRPFLVPMIAAFEQALQDCDATAVFNGTGGDNVFCFLQSATPAADRLASGDPIGAAATINDIARLTGASYATVALAAVRRLAQGRRARAWRRDPRFMPAELVRNLPGYAHTWLEPPHGARLGTAAHVVMLLRSHNYTDPWASGWPADVVNPLLTQPIVEYCLSIASWDWCRGGVDRAVARAAFADRLPPAILHRTWKGGPDGLIAAIVDRNRASIGLLLAEGRLAQQGLVDAGAVRDALDSRRSLAAADALRLLSLVDTEAWVRAHD